jgi:hypothetical protein
VAAVISHSEPTMAMAQFIKRDANAPLFEMEQITIPRAK